jgi:cyanophycinase
MTWWSLLGSGEFQPWSEPVDRRLLEEADGDGRVLILPTASAPEGKDVFERWGSLGLAHFSRIDVAAEVLDVKTREDSDDPRLVEKLEGASAVYFSGGNPAYLAATLADSDLLEAMLKQLERGMAYAGCSAGVACLNELTFDSDTTDMGEVWKPGLSLVPRTMFAPHWDMVDSWIPGAADFILSSVPEGHTFIGLDEDTAMVGTGETWEVMGRSGVHIRRDGRDETYRERDRFDLALI